VYAGFRKYALKTPGRQDKTLARKWWTCRACANIHRYDQMLY